KANPRDPQAGLAQVHIPHSSPPAGTRHLYGTLPHGTSNGSSGWGSVLVTRAQVALALRGAVRAIEGAIAAGYARPDAAVIGGERGDRRARSRLRRRELAEARTQDHVHCPRWQAGHELQLDR